MVTAGNTNDCTRFSTVMEAIWVPRIGPAPEQAASPHRGQGLQLEGNPHPAASAGHRAHDPRAGGPGPQPPPAWQPRRSAPVFVQQIYKRRNVAERCFSRLKQWCGIATRYEKTAEPYQAAVTLAPLPMWA